MCDYQLLQFKCNPEFVGVAISKKPCAATGITVVRLEDGYFWICRDWKTGEVNFDPLTCSSGQMKLPDDLSKYFINSTNGGDNNDTNSADSALAGLVCGYTDFGKTLQNEIFGGCGCGAISIAVSENPNHLDKTNNDCYKNVGGNSISESFDCAVKKFKTACGLNTKPTQPQKSGEEFEKWLRTALTKGLLGCSKFTSLPTKWDSVGADCIDIANCNFTFCHVQGVFIESQNDFWENKGTCDFAGPSGNCGGYTHFIEAKIASSNKVNIKQSSYKLISEAINKSQKYVFIIICLDFPEGNADPASLLILKPDSVAGIWKKMGTTCTDLPRLHEKDAYKLTFGYSNGTGSNRNIELIPCKIMELRFSRPSGNPCYEYPVGTEGKTTKVFIR